jgi:hypothetical protein
MRFRTEQMAPDAGVMLNYTFAAGNYFSTMGIAVQRGREFEQDDHDTSARSVVISRLAADRLWPGADPIGRRLRGAEVNDWYGVVGVVDDVVQNDLREPPQPTVYLPMVGPEPTAWAISSPAYVMKTQRAETIAPEVRALVRDFAPEAPMYRAFTMAGLARDNTIRVTFTMLTLIIVASLALILGAIGLYGVLSYIVAQRTREIGVRLALGAETGRVRRMVVAQGAKLVIIGVIGGVIVALAATRALDTLLFGVERTDVLTFAFTSAWIISVGLLASWIPALRASRVDPNRSLKE